MDTFPVKIDTFEIFASYTSIGNLLNPAHGLSFAKIIAMSVLKRSQ
jgi:hypothetical protein